MLTLFFALISLAAVLYDYKKKILKVSPFALVPLVIFFFGAKYTTLNNVSDYFHFGETFATYWLAKTYNLQYLSDIYITHGLCDVFPGYISEIIFGKLSINNFLNAQVLINNTIILLMFIFISFLFQKNYLFLILFLIFPPTNITSMTSLCRLYLAIQYLYFAFFITLFNNKIFEKPCLWLLLYTVSSCLFCTFQLNVGFPYLIVTLPFAVYIFIKSIKNIKNIKNKLFFISIAVLFIIYILFKTMPYITQLFYNSQYYLHVWGNFIPHININNIFNIVQYAFFPLFFALFIKEFLKKEKNIKNLAILFITISFSIIRIKYELGRPDYTFARSIDTSHMILSFLVPYFIFINKEEYPKIYQFFKKFLSILFIYYLLSNVRQPLILNKTIDTQINTYSDTAVRLIKQIDKTNDKTYLNLTNAGMYYYFLNKKPPINFMVQTNIYSPDRCISSLKYLENNPPEIIHFLSGRPSWLSCISININPIYKWIFLKNSWNVVTKDNVILLVKSDKPRKFTQKELEILDNSTMSMSNLQKLPEAWGKYFKKLKKKLKQVDFKYKIENNKEKNSIEIEFEKPIKGIDIDFILLKNNIALQAPYIISIDSSKSNILFTSSSKQSLIPFDNFPSWLLSEKIKKITIYYEDFMQDAQFEIEFYKQKHIYF